MILSRTSIRRFCSTALAISIASLIAAEPSEAAVLLGNLPATDDGSNTAVTSSNPKSFLFTMGSTAYTVDNVVLRLGNYRTDLGDVAQLGFYEDNGSQTNVGSLVGSLLQAPTSTSATIGNFTFLPSGALTLNANTTYWLLLKAGAGSIDWKLRTTSVTPTGTGATAIGYRFSFDSGATYSTSAAQNSLQINATAVPEPGSALLFAGGVIFLGLRRSRS